MRITVLTLIRWAGLAAVVEGTRFIVIQSIYPLENLSSVTSDAWAIIHYLTIFMSHFGLIVIAGISARQVKEACWFIGDMCSYLNGERKYRTPYLVPSGIYRTRYETHVTLRKFVQGAEL